MDLEALTYENLIPLKELFPGHDVKNAPSSLYLIISQKPDSTHFYKAKIGQLPTGLSMEKSHIFPLFVDAPSGKGQIANLNASIIHEFEKILSLAFLPEKPLDLNMCYANSDEVRKEFKSTFTSIDVFDYLLAVLNSKTFQKVYRKLFQNDLPGIPYPKNDHDFWEMVELGRNCR